MCQDLYQTCKSLSAGNELEVIQKEPSLEKDLLTCHSTYTLCKTAPTECQLAAKKCVIKVLETTRQQLLLDQEPPESRARYGLKNNIM